MEPEEFERLAIRHRVPTLIEKWNLVAADRNARFDGVLFAIDRLMLWARDERRRFIDRVLGAAPKRRAAPVIQCLGFPVVRDIDEEDSDADMPAVGTGVRSTAASSADMVAAPRCSFAPKKATLKSGPSHQVVMDMVGGDVMIDDKTVRRATAELWEDCVSLCPRVVGLSSDDIAGILQDVDGAPGSNVDNQSHEAAADEFPDDSSDSGAEGHEHGDLDRADPSRLSPSLPAVGGEPRLTFIMNRGKSGKWKFVSLARYNADWRKHLVDKLPEGAKFLFLADMLFGSALVLGRDSLEQLSQPLAAVFEACRGRFWELPSTTPPASVLRNPPPEIHIAISREMFCQEYNRLREWLREIATLPYGHEFFKLERFRVQRLDGREHTLGDSFLVSPKDITNKWPPRYVPSPGSLVSSRTFGECRLLEVERSPDMTRFYEYTMSRPTEEVRHRGTWHVVVAWHFYVHAATSSESLAESVGSCLNLFHHRNTNGKLHTKRIAWGAHLRSAGLRGLGGEEGILAMALNMHFRSEGPDGWHFHATRTSKPAVGGARLRREVALLSRPLWFGTPLFDLVRSRHVHLCKALPFPEQFIMLRKDTKVAPELPSKRRRSLQEMANQAYEPDHIEPSLWKRLGISVLSLPEHLRPGKRAR